ncbi:SMU1112c/YaeR family gloxylase I-like metalloprotein [Marinilactibacillus piezotolerans]|uniref:SMU1112c/YaeR family gloxylase I-like metalloprotein n=1 Tax=Marinilactibacillus piezotolerans TaxID=258723 RepID=UPI0009AF29D1|nr:VOC family protein [Marinilactibacillus piezotolerans]
MLNRIHHTAIIASDYERSKQFYTEQLELKVINETYREERDSYKLDLAIGDAQIELFSFPDPPERVSSPEARGLRHLCFEVEDVQAAAHWLQKKGIETEPIRIDPITQKAFTFFKDPDDLPLELYEK